MGPAKAEADCYQPGKLSVSNFIVCTKRLHNAKKTTLAKQENVAMRQIFFPPMNEIKIK